MPLIASKYTLQGLLNRTGATSINSESSRSHTVFTCVLESRCKVWPFMVATEVMVHKCLLIMVVMIHVNHISMSDLKLAAPFCRAQMV